MRAPQPSIPHYYGDVARMLMIGGIGLMLLGIPFASEFMKAFIPLEIAVSIPLVALAAFTNPWQKIVIVADILFSGAMAMFFEFAVYRSFEEQDLSQFVLYVTIGLLFLLAFYYYVKTIRAMLMHQIGREDSLEDFSHSHGSNFIHERKENPLAREQSYSPDFRGD